MFDSVLLNLSIGLAFFYLLLSLVLASANEVIAGFTRLRNGFLERAMIMLLGGERFVALFYRHPLLKGFSHGRESPVLSFICGTFMRWKIVRMTGIDRLVNVLRLPYLLRLVVSGRPSYLSSRTFALVMTDLLDTGRSVDEKFGPDAMIEYPDPATGETVQRKIEPADIDLLRTRFSYFAGIVDHADDLKKSTGRICKLLERGLEETDTGKLRAQFLPFARLVNRVENSLGSGVGEREKAVRRIAEWFDLQMERVTGWYRRTVQAILLVAALLVTVSLNADTLMMANVLWSDPVMRAAVIEEATATVQESRRAETDEKKGGAAAPDSSASDYNPCSGCGEKDAIDIAAGSRKDRPFPIGWATPSSGREEVRSLPSSFAGWVYKIIGILITTFLVSLGAPFWFDTLSRLVNVRTAGVKPRTARTEIE